MHTADNRLLFLRLISIGILVLSAGMSGHARSDVSQVSPEDIHRELPNDPWLAVPADVELMRTVALPIVRSIYTSVQVNTDEFGMNIVGDAANEPSIAIDPNDRNKMAIGWRQFDTIASDFRQAGWAYSEDAGAAWTFPGALAPGLFGSDPVLGSDADGVFYYVSIDTNEVRLFRSFNGGKTWTSPTRAVLGFRDKEWMAIDRTGGVGHGNIYLAWSGLESFARSVDSGLNFSLPIDAPLANPFWGTMFIANNGDLFLADRFFNVVKSTDAKFSAGVPTFEVVGQADLGGSIAIGGVPNPSGLLGQVSIAGDNSDGPNSGNLYLLASVDPPGPDPLDVMFSRSTDDGETWSDPVRINTDPTNNGAWQWFGTMSVAPNGRIDVIWNDTRVDSSGQFTEVYYSCSNDGGLDWTQGVPITWPFNHTLGYPRQEKLGDYYHMVSDDISANLAFAATFNGEQDIYFISIPGDCNLNETPDEDDIASGFSQDCTGNGIPDECEVDCNGNGRADSCDILTGESEDCGGNQIPDECESDCNDNGTPDSCDIANKVSEDANENGLPDECESILFVDDNAQGANDGLSWPNAFDDIQAALLKAEISGGVVEQIWVAAGSYRPALTNRYRSFLLVNGVVLLGGFAGNEETADSRNWAVNQTILTGDLNGDDGPDFASRGDNSFHVVSASDVGVGTILDGFVITGGNSDGDILGDNGGGLAVADSILTVRNCLFELNSAASNGGAIRITNSSEVSVSNCIFLNNDAVSGGAFSLSRRSTALLENCTLAGNNVNGFGGGLIVFSTARAELVHTIVWGNDDFTGTGFDAQILLSGGEADLRFSCVQGLPIGPDSDGNIGADPMFEVLNGFDNSTAGVGVDTDLRLSVISPCINAGDPLVLQVAALDLDHHPRVLCGRVDMGAYESGIGDFDCNRATNVADFTGWDACMVGPDVSSDVPACAAFDFNGDGHVDLRDAVFVNNSFPSR